MRVKYVHTFVALSRTSISCLPRSPRVGVHTARENRVLCVGGARGARKPRLARGGARGARKPRLERGARGDDISKLRRRLVVQASRPLARLSTKAAFPAAVDRSSMGDQCAEWVPEDRSEKIARGAKEIDRSLASSMAQLVLDDNDNISGSFVMIWDDDDGGKADGSLWDDDGGGKTDGSQAASTETSSRTFSAALPSSTSEATRSSGLVTSGGEAVLELDRDLLPDLDADRPRSETAARREERAVTGLARSSLPTPPSANSIVLDNAALEAIFRSAVDETGAEARSAASLGRLHESLAEAITTAIDGAVQRVFGRLPQDGRDERRSSSNGSTVLGPEDRLSSSPFAPDERVRAQPSNEPLGGRSESASSTAVDKASKTVPTVPSGLASSFQSPLSAKGAGSGAEKASPKPVSLFEPLSSASPNKHHHDLIARFLATEANLGSSSSECASTLSTSTGFHSCSTSVSGASAPRPTPTLAALSFGADEARVPRALQRAFSPAETGALRLLVRQLEKRGMIRKSTSAFSSPIFLRQDDGRDSIASTVTVGGNRVQLGVDWRGLDAAMTLSKLPRRTLTIPRQRLIKARFFSKIDLRSGYLRMPLREDCRKYTAFQAPLGKYEWCVAPLGLRGVQGAFAHALSNLFATCGLSNSILVLPADLVIFSDTREQHAGRLVAIGKVLRRFGLEANAWGSSYYAPGIDIQGLWIHKGTIEVDSSRFEALEALNLDSAACAGMQQLSSLLTPSMSLAFDNRDPEAIRCAVVKSMRRDAVPVGGPFIIYVAFGLAPSKRIGGVLVRDCGKGVEKVVAFASRPALQRSLPHELFAAAIIDCLTEFRSIISGHRVEIRGSYESFDLYVARNSSSVAALVAAELREFAASIRYVPASRNRIAMLMAKSS